MHRHGVMTSSLRSISSRKWRGWLGSMRCQTSCGRFGRARHPITRCTLLLGVYVMCWSVPDSLQLGFLLAQGSEFAFVVFSVPPLRALIGEATASVIVAAVALSLAATPSLAEAGRALLEGCGAGEASRKTSNCSRAISRRP